MFEFIQDINPTYLSLAYSGMLIRTAISAHKAYNKYRSEFHILRFLKYNALALVADLVAIPVLLAMFSEPSISTIYPLNNITATMSGYLSQSVLEGIFKRHKETK